MRVLLLTLFFLVTAVRYTDAQGYRPDRPYAAKSGYITPVKTFSWEHGSVVEIIDRNNFAFDHIDLNVRIGMMKLMEMSLGISVPAIRDPVLENNDNKPYKIGFASPRLGIKVAMKEKEDQGRMAMAFFGQAGLNFGSEDFKDTKILPAFSIAMDIDWNERTNMRVNYGMIWLENRSVIDPEDNPVIDPYIHVAVDVTGRINDRLAVFGEIFGRVKYNNFRSGYYAAFGTVLHLQDNAQLDISGGAGLSPESSRGFVQIGFSGLWPKKNIPWSAVDYGI
jgi:hypothetical protein